MLKSISHIVLALLLFAATTGMAVSKHYCGDALVDIAYNENADACCDTGSCCHNETQIFQLDEDFSAPQIASTPDLQEFVVFGFTVFAVEQTPAEQTAETFFHNNSPPPPTIKEAISFRQVFLL